jgi:hypothetical protein
MSRHNLTITQAIFFLTPCSHKKTIAGGALDATASGKETLMNQDLCNSLAL